MKKKFIYILLICLISCNNQIKIKSPILQPEILLDSYAEKISFSLKDEKSFIDISDLIARDKPASAEVLCNQSNNICIKVKNLLKLNNVKFKESNTSIDSKILFDFNHIIAKDCKSFNAETKELTLGCATSANMIQMISDYKQFTKPDIMDYPSSIRPIQDYNNYLKKNGK